MSELVVACRKWVAQAYLGSYVRSVHGNGETANLVCGGYPFIELSRRVVSRKPGCLTVSRVTAATIVLLLTSIDNGNTVREEDVGEYILRLRIIARVAKISCQWRINIQD
jgi:hypothetical protein